VRTLRAGPPTGPILAALLVLGTIGCETPESVFPSTGSMRVTLRDNDLATQSTSGSVQVMRWILDSVTGTVSGVPDDFPFMEVSPCFYQDNVFFRGDLASQCLGTGVILGATPTTVTFHVKASRIEMHRAARPDLPDFGDYDGDGVLNVTDNCKIVFNPPDPVTGLQVDVNGDGVGDVCEIVDSTGVLVPDQDLDGVRDSADNCQFVANPLDSTGFQPDADGDFIGDACEQLVPVVIPGGTLKLDCPGGSFVPAESVLTLFIIAFDHETALSCPPSFSSCTLDPTKVTVFRSGTDATQAPACVVVP
jgi:hypothetical protein